VSLKPENGHVANFKRKARVRILEMEGRRGPGEDIRG